MIECSFNGYLWFWVEASDRFVADERAPWRLEPEPRRPTDVEATGTPPDWLIRVVNPLLKLLLRSPLHGPVSDHLAPLTVTGRKAGEYTFPAGYERENDTVYVTSHGTNWWKNLRQGGQEVTVVLRGERLTGHVTVEEDDRAVAGSVYDVLQREGTGAACRVGLDVAGEAVPPVDVLEDAVDHVVIVTIDVDGDESA